jgi:hypothetical protein
LYLLELLFSCGYKDTVDVQIKINTMNFIRTSLTLLIACTLLSCVPPKKIHYPFIPERFPAIETLPVAAHKTWLNLFFETATRQEQKEHWSILFDDNYSKIRQESISIILEKTLDPVIATAFIANPNFPAFERCFIAIKAKQLGIPIRQNHLPKNMVLPHDKLYCALYHSIHTNNPQPFLRIFQHSELPLNTLFYKTLAQFPFEKDLISPLIKEKLRGGEDNFTFLSLYCAWFLIDPELVREQLIAHLIKAQEDDRLEVLEFFWGDKRADSIFVALSNTDLYSGVYAKISRTSSGHPDVKFTLSYLNEGATWELRLLALEALGMWHGKNISHPESRSVQKELLNLIETDHKDVLISLLRGIRMSDITESITLILAIHPKDPHAQLERAATIRMLTVPHTQ